MGISDELFRKPVYVNDSESAEDEVPAFGVMQSKGADAVARTSRIKITKPDGEGTVFFVNGKVNCPRGKPANYQPGNVVRVLYDSEAEPQFGDVYGPIGNQWYCGPDTAVPIFKVIGLIDAQRKVILAQVVDPIPISAVLDEQLEQGSFALATIRNRAFGSAHDSDPLQETDTQIRVFDSTLGDEDDPIPVDTPIIAALQGDGRYYVTTAGCSTIERAEEEE